MGLARKLVIACSPEEVVIDFMKRWAAFIVGNYYQLPFWVDIEKIIQPKFK
jgi:hypothetical protein